MFFMRRTPAVSGQFYQGDPAKLREQVEGFIDETAPKQKALAVLSPHAGLMYSGNVAGSVYSSIEFPDTFVLMGPNHTGLGADIALMAEGQWEIPTAVFGIDEVFSRRILKNVQSISRDIKAHMFEHSLEVQLPFIAHFTRHAKIVPICIKNASLTELKELGEGIAKAVKDVGYGILIAASSDMSHYVSEEVAKIKDMLAIERILKLDPEGLHETVIRENISMCGYKPAVAMLYASVALGAKEARLIKYTTSGEVSGDYEHVVGYAGVIVK
jgi:AmmeMemoRadiSam system protein B